MAILALSIEELQVLSLVSGKRIKSYSVLNGIKDFNRETFEANKKLHAEIVSNFIEDGAIWTNEEGKPFLIRELQTVFNIINAPERTIKIKPASEKPFEEHFYSYKDSIGVLFSVSKDEKIYSIEYPYNKSIFETWFKENVIGDLEIEEETEFHNEWILSSEEFNILSLLIINNNYIKYTNSKKVLKIDELMNEDLVEKINNMNLFKLNQETVDQIMKSDNFTNVINSLESKGALELKSDEIILNKVICEGFESGNLRDVIELTEIDPFMRIKNLYITNLGYILFEPMIVKPLQWKITTMGLKNSHSEFMEKLLEFSGIQPNEKLKMELKKHIN
ncbi:MAG: hypothetical protein JXI43_08430 [Tissierellales bacterium]|nr:hypothetical protein [Tissierellales bacterium]